MRDARGERARGECTKGDVHKGSGLRDGASFSKGVEISRLERTYLYPFRKRNSPVTYLSRSLKTRIDVLYILSARCCFSGVKA